MTTNLPERFEVRGALGSGGVADVYEVMDRAAGATVALKILRDVTPDALYRLKREFRLLQGLEHPNVCRHYELFEHAGQWFITMECVRGDDILRHVRARPAALRGALAQLAAALCALHDAGLVHRDLKPSNVMVAPDGRVVLLDFGFVEETAHRTRSMVGTPAYMAPEQAQAVDVGPPADWYSFGVILYELLTGRLPHDAETSIALMLVKQHLKPAPPVSAHGDLDTLCVELLCAQPAARPSGQEVARRLGSQGRPSHAAIATGPALVGRESELAQLRAAYDERARGRPVTVRVAGASGIGKTALVRRFAEQVSARGALVLAGRCYERESVPYKAFDSIVDALARADIAELRPQHAELLVRMFPVLGAVYTDRAPVVAGDPQEQRTLAFAALRELLQLLAARRPLVVVIDDWQWADADSVVLARDLLRHHDSPALLLVLIARSGDVAAVAGDARTIDVATLADDAALELARRMRAAIAPELALDLAAIAREARGHPLHIAELVRHAAAHGSTAIRLEDAIRARIAELPDGARAIVEALSVAGEPLPLDVTRDAVGLRAAELERDVSLLVLANLARRAVGAVEPYHDRVREAVLERMPGDELVAWHGRLATALEASPLADARPELLLRHLAGAGQRAKAAAVAVAAARRAANAGAFDQAASLFGSALRGELDQIGLGQTASGASACHERVRELRGELGQALANAGRGHAAAEAFLTAAEGAEPAARLDLVRRAAEQLLMIGELERGLELLRTLLAEVGIAMPTTQQRALASLLWQRAKLKMRGLAMTERAAADVPNATLLRLDVLQAASHCLGLVDNIRAADFNARWLLLALRTGERMRCAFALATESVYQSSTGAAGIARARTLLETVHQLGAGADDPRLRAFVMMSEGMVEFWVCRLARADGLITEAERIFRDQTTGTGPELKSTRMFLAFTLRHRGAWARLRRLHDEYVSDADRRGDRYVMSSLDRYCSTLWLAGDDPATARQMLANASWVPPSSALAFHTQHWYELEARAEIAIYERTVAAELPALEPAFAALGRSVLTRVTTIRAQALWLRGRFAVVTGDLAGARRAVARLARLDHPRAAVAAALLSAACEPDAARRHLRAAAELAADHDLLLHAATAQRQAGTLLGGDDGAQLVAAADAALAAEGVVAPARFADWLAPIR